MSRQGTLWEETLFLSSARENGNLQHGAVSVDEKLVRDSMGGRNLVSLTLTGFLLKASEAHQVSFEDDRGRLKIGILSNRFIKVSLN